MLPVETPFKTYTGLDGKPLDNGYIYFGQPDQDPVAHPVTVYWDAAGTIPAAQPLRTMNGYIMNAGTPANVFFNDVYSELVKDSKGRQVFYARTSEQFSIATLVLRFLADISKSSGASLMGFVQSGAGAVRMSVQDALRERTSVGQFGMVGDGTDETARFNDLCKNTPVGSLVNLLPKTYLLNAAYNEQAELVGTKGTILKAAPGAQCVMSLGRHLPDWNYYGVSSLTFDGNGKTAYCIDLNNDDVGAAPFGGRWVFDRVGFVNASTGVYAKTGNIGNTYRNCYFSDNDYGVRLTTEGSAGVMHAGCSVFEVCQFSAHAKAAIYVNDAVDGLGQYDFNDVIAQGNPGFAVFMKLSGISPFAGITFRNFWGEQNATGGVVNIDGVNYTPREIYLQGARPVVFENSYLKDVQLVNSTLLAKGCRIDDGGGTLKLDVDARSQLIADDVYINNGINGVPFVRSIAACTNTTKSGNKCVRGPLRTSRVTLPAGASLLKENYDGVGPWLFSGTAGTEALSVADGVISDSCAELTIPAGYTLLNPGFFTPMTGKWIVWGIHLKLQSGAPLTTCSFSYNSSLGNIYQRAGEWVCTYGIQEVGEAFSEITTYFSNTSGAPTTIRLADLFVVQFDSMEAAYAFCNSRAAVR